MKKIVLFTAILGLAFASCKDNNGGDAAITLDVTDPAKVAAEGGEVRFDITSNSDWTVTKADTDTWFTLGTTGGYGNSDITVLVKKNTGAERTASITVKAGDIIKVATLTQSASDMLDATTPPNAPHTSGEVTFDITANIDWTITAADTWITGVEPKTGTGNATVTVKVAGNANKQPRTSTLVITSSKGGEFTKNVTITQNGIPDPVEGTYSLEGWAFLLKKPAVWTGTITRDGDRFVLDKMPFIREEVEYFHKLFINSTQTSGTYRIESNSTESVGTMDYQGKTLEIFQTIAGYESPDAEISKSYEMLTGSIDVRLSGNSIIIPEKMTIRVNNEAVEVYTAIGSRVILNGQSRSLTCTGEMTVLRDGSAAPMIVVEKGKTVDMTDAEVAIIKPL
jgi:hypothetical protein